MTSRKRNIWKGTGSARMCHVWQNIPPEVILQMNRKRMETMARKRRRGEEKKNENYEENEPYFEANNEDEEDEDENNEDGDLTYEDFGVEADLEENVQLVNAATSSSNTNEEDIHTVFEEIRCFLPMMRNFSIVAQATTLTQECVHFEAPVDDNRPLWNTYGVGDDAATTKGDFIRGLFRLLSSKNVIPTVQHEIYKYLRTGFPKTIDFPAARTRRETRNMDGTLMLEYGYEDYTDIGKPDYLTFDVCRNGCCVFAGEENGGLQRCANHNCKAFRYNPCTKCHRADSCNHNPLTARTPHSTIRYRPVITLLTKLVTKYPEFVKLCKFSNRNISLPVDSKDGYILDFLDAHVAIKQLISMERNYNEQLRKGLDPSYEQLNLLLGQFYDGAQVFKRKVTPFWPIVIQILSLPPILRGKLGIGTFLLSIISVDSHAQNGVERFIYRDCLVAELEELQWGIKIESNDGKKYFLQARMVMHCLDSPALAKMLRIKGKGANVGCSLCLSFDATRRTLLSKSAIYDHRRLLGYDNILRSFGQSNKCCPSDFYKQPNPQRDQALEAILRAGRFKGMMLPPQSSNSIFFQTWCLASKPNDPSPLPNEIIESTKRLLMNNNQPFQCYNKCFRVDKFKSLFGNYLYFPHANYMKQVKYSRVTNNRYLRNTLEYHRKLRDGYFNRENNDHHVDGVREAWEFARLSYTDFQRHICWDPFHVIMNVCDNILRNLKGQRLTANSVALCQITGCHPSLWLEAQQRRGTDVPSFPAYVLSADAQNSVDAYMACLLLPVGSKQDYKVQFPFGRMGYLKGHQNILLLTVYIDYLLYGVSDLPKEYKNGLSLYGWNISRLLSPVLQIKNDRQEDELRNQIIESMCILEGLFPESEAMFPKHQLLDLVSQLKEFGPMKGWWSLFGERAIGILKRFIPHGGRNYCLSTFVQYIDYENSINQQFFMDIQRVLNEGTNGPADANEETFTDVNEYLAVDRNGDYHYDGFSTFMSCPIRSKNISINQHDLQLLLVTILEEIQKRCGSNWEAMRLSPLFYLVEYYRSYVRTTAPNIMKFLEWIRNDFDEWEQANANIIDERNMSELTHDGIEQVFQQGHIFRSCVMAARRLLAFNVEMFNRATILGTPLCSRGFHCRESKMDKRDNSAYGRQEKKYIVQNDANKLRKTWHESTQYSCWCKLMTTKPSKNLLSRPAHERPFGGFYKTDLGWNERLHLYAQINCFFAISMPEDDMVSKIALASVTCRTYNDVETEGSFRNLYEMNVEDKDSFYKDIRFVPISHIVPTIVAVAGLKRVPNQANIYKPIRVLQQNDDRDFYDYSFPKETVINNESVDTVIDKLLLINVNRTHAEEKLMYIVGKIGHRAFQVFPLGKNEFRSEWKLQWENEEEEEEKEQE